MFLLLCFGLLFASEPGGIREQEIDVISSQDQTDSPAISTIHNKLFYKNGELKKLDISGVESFVSAEKDNILKNPGFENIPAMDGWTATAGVTATETTAPLFGLHSMVFDPSTQNDFLESDIVAIPKGLYRSACMAQFAYTGGDGTATSTNSFAQVINANGDVLASTSLERQSESFLKTIPFQCPNQLAVSGDANLGKIKLKFVQTTTTNGAAITIDRAYIGTFNSNRIGVVGETEGINASSCTVSGPANVQCATYTNNTISNTGTISNFGTPFIFTAKIKSKISIVCSLKTNANNGFAASIRLNGIDVQQTSIDVSGSGYGGTISWNGILNQNDQIVCYQPGGSFNLGYLTLTATPLPQLATIVDTGQPPAGWLASRAWNTNFSCQWSRTSSIIGPFSPVAACATKSDSGLAVADSTTDGQLPAITVSKLPKGIVNFIYTGGYSSSSATTCIYHLYLNGSLITTNQISGGATTDYGGRLFFTFRNQNELLNSKLEIYNNNLSVQACAIYGRNDIHSKIDVYYYPDLSTPYAETQNLAILDPQVINSSGKKWATESCYLTNAGTAAMASPACNTWISSVNRVSVGNILVNFLPNIWSQTPICISNLIGINPLNDNSSYTNGPTLTNLSIFTVNGGVGVDAPISLNCSGFTP